LLLGKYGEEADKLVYTFEDQGERRVGLRYDQTVPVARILAQYRNNMPKFFRRYQIQNVFRAEKPQAGRFREFTQCDIDIFGTNSTLADAEILACVYATYQNIGFEQIKILINDRRLLVETLRPLATEQISALNIVQTLDKLNKIGQEKVIKELIGKGLSQDTAQQCLDQVKQLQPSNNLLTIIEQAVQLGISKQDLVFSPTLARGLDYYTGMIFEVSLPQYETGSLGGGGRYDDLIKQLGGIEMPAVGFGMGFDRTVEAANQLGLIPNLQASAQVLVTLFDQTTIEASLKTATQLRQAGISVELYPELDKIGKQLKIANQKQIPWVIIIGQEEAAQNQVALKNMKAGDQTSVSLDEAITAIQT
jgi:histidyl-tRNA synthetase